MSPTFLLSLLVALVALSVRAFESDESEPQQRALLRRVLAPNPGTTTEKASEDKRNLGVELLDSADNETPSLLASAEERELANGEKRQKKLFTRGYRHKKKHRKRCHKSNKSSWSWDDDWSSTWWSGSKSSKKTCKSKSGKSSSWSSSWDDDWWSSKSKSHHSRE